MALAVTTEHEDYLGEKVAPPVRAILIADGSGMIVTERDLAQAVSSGKDPATPVSAVARRCPGLVAVPAGTSILEAARLMMGDEVGQVIVSDDGGEGSVVSLRGRIKGLSAAC